MIYFTAAVGILVSGIYIAIAGVIKRKQGKMRSLLALVNAIFYTWVTSAYVWDIITGHPRGGVRPLSLFLFLLPALLVFQVSRWSWKDDANVTAILEKYND